MPLLLLGSFAPSLIALALTARHDGRAGLRALLRRLVDGDIAARWYLFAIGYWAAIKLSVALVHRIAIGAWPAFGSMPWGLMLVSIAISTPFQAGEEIGWRGYGLPRLGAQLGLARASLLLGAIWAGWHLPLFFVPGHNNHEQSFPAFAIGGIGLSVAMAWLYANTRGSLLLAMLMHSAVNHTNGIVPTRLAEPANPLVLDTAPPTLISGAVVAVATVCFLVLMRHVEASPAAGPRGASFDHARRDEPRRMRPS